MFEIIIFIALGTALLSIVLIGLGVGFDTDILYTPGLILLFASCATAGVTLIVGGIMQALAATA